MKKFLQSAIFLVILLAVSASFMTVNAEGFQTKLALSCDKMELNAGEATTCDVHITRIASNDDYGSLFTGLEGAFVHDDNLAVENMTMKMENAKLTPIGADGFKITLPTKKAFDTELLMQVTIRTKKDTRVTKTGITVRTVRECPDFLKGDVDSDGDVDKDDADKAFNISVGLDTATPYILAVADFDNNGKITAVDATQILSIAQLDDISAFKGKGDIDNDGDVDENDWTIAGRLAVNDSQYQQYSARAKEVADFDNNGEITVTDALMVMRIAYGYYDVRTESVKEYACFDVAADRDGSYDYFEFKVNPAAEVVSVPDTLMNAPILIYITGALFMAFGVYLLVMARKLNKNN